MNDVLDDLVFCEETLISDAYKEGWIKGKSEGNTEGYHLGYHRGAELGAELGYYFGICTSLLNDKCNLSDKVRGHVETVVKLINDFPKSNTKDTDILKEFEVVQALFKKVCSLQKINTGNTETDKLSF